MKRRLDGLVSMLLQKKIIDISQMVILNISIGPESYTALLLLNLLLFKRFYDAFSSNQNRLITEIDGCSDGS